MTHSSPACLRKKSEGSFLLESAAANSIIRSKDVRKFTDVIARFSFCPFFSSCLFSQHIGKIWGLVWEKGTPRREV